MKVAIWGAGKMGQVHGQAYKGMGKDVEIAYIVERDAGKAAEFSGWDQRKLQKELFDVDFGGYDFGQPEIKNPDADGEDEEKHETKTCPCCGEVFEV